MGLSDAMRLRVAKILEDAAGLLDKPGVWTRGFYARNECGSAVPIHADTATCWCALGSIYKVSDTARTAAGSAIANIAAEVVEEELGEMLPDWNDRKRSGKPVVALFRRVARRLRREAS